MGIKESKYIWFDGELVPWADAQIHVMTHALHYGSSVFEGIRAYPTGNQGTVVFRLQDHTERFFDSAKIHRLNFGFTPEQINEACRAVVRQNRLPSAYVRPIIFRGMGDLSLTGTQSPVHVAVAAFEWGAYLGEEALAQGVDTCVSSWTRAAPNTFPAMAKAGGNYLSSQLIGAEAARHGYAEGIALDHNGLVSEGSGENIFLVKRGKLITPPLCSAVLPGITRDTVMTLARSMGIETKEERLPREGLYVADEAFFTGTAAEVSPIRSVDGIQIGDGRRGPITQRLQDAFFGLFDGRTQDEWGWLDPVSVPALAVADG